MTFYDAIKEQIRQEIGEDRWEEETIPQEEMYILSQKFGLRVPVLTQSEVYLIHREEGFTRGRYNRSKNRSQRS